MDWQSVTFDWNQVRAFLVTAEEGSFSAAGRALGLTQPTTVPFGLTAAEHASWIYHGGGQELWDEVAAPFDIKPFLRASTGSRNNRPSVAFLPPTKGGEPPRQPESAMAWPSKRFTRASGMAVLSVDYRLAPENPFPAGQGRSYASLWPRHKRPRPDV